MSDPSRRYSFLLWIAVTLIFLVFAVLHWTGSRGGFVGAKWSKWSLRRRTWRKKHSLAVAQKGGQPHRQPLSLPSNSQILCLCLLLLATAALSVAGPDYIAPGVKVWQFSKSNPSTSDTTPGEQPQYTIWKTWWTSAGRTGLIAFALMPLCILFALKAPPFAIFAISFMIQLQFDKLSWLHRWSGRLIWLVTAAHVALWTVQMCLEVRPETGKKAIVYAWDEIRFIWGWAAFGLLTLIIILSIKPIRRAHYESFWFLHALLVPMMLVASAFHHPQVWWWCWAALGLWAGERIWRATWWLHCNGYFGGMSAPQQTNGAPMHALSNKDAWEMKGLRGQSLDSAAFPVHPSRHSDARTPTFKSPLSPGGETNYQRSMSGHSQIHYPSRPPSPSASLSLRAALPPAEPYMPPPGYAHAELLSGRTIRLRFLSPGFVSWAPGQHFLINIPSVSHFTSHPFTVASICDEAGPDSARAIVLLIRAKNGWTRDLWDTVSKLCWQRQSHPKGERPTRGAEMPARGVLMRMYIDGPFGSSVRARWGNHSSVLIITGGSGVSFGMSVLEYVCMCLSGRDGKVLGGRPGGWGKKGFETQRVRFVWLVREFCHIQWCASTLHRCLAMVPAPGLQVDIFVTNFTPPARPRYNMPPPALPAASFSDVKLVPPTPNFAREAKSHFRRDSVESEDGDDDDVDLSYYTGAHSGHSQYQPARTDEEQAGGDFNYGPDHEDHILDYTNFDGDDDQALPGEEVLNQTVKKQGKLRRAKTRKATRATPAAMERLRERRAKSTLGHGDIHHPPAETQLAARESQAQSHATTTSHGSAASVDRLLSYTSKPGPSMPERHLPTPLEMDLGSPTAAHSEDAPWRLPPSRTHTPAPTYTEHSEAGHFSNWDAHSDIASTREMMMSRTGDRPGDEIALEVDERELHDVSVVSEHARPGKPKLDRILADEVENSKGSVIVACCGPTSLNALVRKIIAAKIDPARIRHGDMRGMISLVSEEFEY
ncbi:hypothetical protein HWV62_7072 [Athelia sp. TMB]|nr:hypothetical protein HWV62_7072 [Athelia sp. TMB]